MALQQDAIVGSWLKKRLEPFAIVSGVAAIAMTSAARSGDRLQGLEAQTGRGKSGPPCNAIEILAPNTEGPNSEWPGIGSADCELKV